MNQYWIIALVASWLVCGFAGWESATWKDGMMAANLAEKQQTNTINAQQSVIIKQQKADEITNNTEVDYAKAIADLDSLYGVRNNDSTSNSLPSVSKAASGTNAGCASKKYKLTPEKCDMTRAKLIALRKWINDQKEIK